MGGLGVMGGVGSSENSEISEHSEQSEVLKGSGTLAIRDSYVKTPARGVGAGVEGMAGGIKSPV